MTNSLGKFLVTGCRALVGKDFALITVRRYESCTRYLAELIKLKYAKVLDSSILKDMMNVKSAIVNLG